MLSRLPVIDRDRIYSAVVPDFVDDTGPTVSQLWAGAWILGFGAVVGWVFLTIELGRRQPWDAATGFALAVGATCSVFAACCAVLVAVKSAEARLRDAGATRRP